MTPQQLRVAAEVMAAVSSEAALPDDWASRPLDEMKDIVVAVIVRRLEALPPPPKENAK